MDDDWTRILLDHLNRGFVSSIWTKDTVNGMSTENIYDALTHVEREKNMYLYNKRGLATSTEDKEVAIAVLEAYATGVDFIKLLKSNPTVRAYWHRIQNDKVAQDQANARLAEQRRKQAEKKKLEDQARAAVAAKLTPEELAAFGLNKKGAKK